MKQITRKNQGTELVSDAFKNKFSEADLQWFEAFQKLEKFNNKKELVALGVNINEKVKNQVRRQAYTKSSQLILGKRGCSSLDELQEKMGGEEFLNNECVKFEYLGKGVLTRKKKAQKKIDAEISRLDNSFAEFESQLKKAIKVGKSANHKKFTEKKTTNGGYSKLTLAEKLMAKFEAEYNNKNNTRTSKPGPFSEGRAS